MSAQDDDDEDVPSQILKHVLLGSRKHARNKELLQRLGITHILNVTPPKKMDPVAGVPNFFDKDKLFTYRRCPIFDNKAEDISGVLEGCIAFIDQAKYYGRILVHCNKGVSRSSSMVVAYLMKLRSLSFDQALSFVVERRHMANPNQSFCRQLEEYGRSLQRSVPKEKGAIRGPVGPQLPSTAGSGEDAAAIGPRLPPHLSRSLGKDKVDADAEAKSDEATEPCLKRERMGNNDRGGNAEDCETCTKKIRVDKT